MSAPLQAVGMSLCPETPVWLAWRGRRQLAAASLRKLHGAALAPGAAQTLEGAAGGLEDTERPLLEGEVREWAAWEERTAYILAVQEGPCTMGCAGVAWTRDAYMQEACVQPMSGFFASCTCAITPSRSHLRCCARSVRHSQPPALALPRPPQAAAGGDTGSSTGAGLGWGALLWPKYRRVMLLAAGLPLAQQLSGINTVIFYSSQVRGMDLWHAACAMAMHLRDSLSEEGSDVQCMRLPGSSYNK